MKGTRLANSFLRPMNFYLICGLKTRNLKNTISPKGLLLGFGVIQGLKEESLRIQTSYVTSRVLFFGQNDLIRHM